MADFKKGERVRLIKDCRDLSHGDEVFKIGEVGTLGKRYRIQDGLQVWELILDKTHTIGESSNPIPTRITVVHTSIEKVS